MLYTMSCEPREMIGDRLAGAREYERGAAMDRAEGNLQLAIAADVVERAPHGRAIRRAAGCHGRQADARLAAGSRRRDVLRQSIHRRVVRAVLKRLASYFRTKPVVMRNTSPLVSFTFDNVPESAYTNGAATLEHYGARGTLYIAARKCGTGDIDAY